MLEKILNLPLGAFTFFRRKTENAARALENTDLWRSLSHSQDLQVSYLSQSVQLEEAGKPLLVGTTLAISSLAVLLFIGWAAVAQINEVTRAAGEIIPLGAQQTVQHPEGGVIAAINVAEGDVVEAGQPLITLTAAGLSEDLARARHKQLVLQLQRERFTALLEKREPDFAPLMENNQVPLADQETLFESLREAHKSEREVVLKQVTQREDDIRILQTSLNTVNQRLALIQTSYVNRKQLAEKGYFPKLKLLELEEQLISLQGQQSELKDKLAQAQASKAETAGKLASLGATQREGLNGKREEVEIELAQNAEIIAKIEHRQNHLTVRAPVRGVVGGLVVNTIGGVVQPGQTLMGIIPLDTPLMVEARVAPKDIGHLQIGQPAQIKVSAYDFSRYGSLEGELAGLSATTFLSEDGQRYFKARIKLKRAYMGNTPGRFPVSPGMTVMADIITGTRSILSYLLKPIHTSLQDALREH